MFLVKPLTSISFPARPQKDHALRRLIPDIQPPIHFFIRTDVSPPTSATKTRNTCMKMGHTLTLKTIRPTVEKEKSEKHPHRVRNGR